MITLVLGGTRSGKSQVAERLAGEMADDVTYVATAQLDPDDPDHADRILRHRRRRPHHWTIIECRQPSDLPTALRETTGVVLVDSLGAWVTSHPDLRLDSTSLVGSLAARSEPTVVVSEEVGMSIHPTTELGRRYIDALGELNQQVAAIAERMLLVVAGRSIVLSHPDKPGRDPSC